MPLLIVSLILAVDVRSLRAQLRESNTVLDEGKLHIVGLLKDVQKRDATIRALREVQAQAQGTLAGDADFGGKPATSPREEASVLTDRTNSIFSRQRLSGTYTRSSLVGWLF